MARHISVYADGICEPNPGHACWAWLAEIDGEIVGRDFGCVGPRSTNNVAEYCGVEMALKWLRELWSIEPLIITFHSDSKLVLNQISGTWGCHKDELRKLRDRCRLLLEPFGPAIHFNWIAGKDNPADELTREAYRKHAGKEPPKRH